ncbi:bacillopeptidase F [Evansella vedderi]|uniref:Bacillopeptidase F n=1 Tax=Evansella vedderi TaxID=38282 RepID=A0ABT9ZU73_9BACI|nr:S8 family serine peptidase [Evansella vedderi]MDQ0254789.1 bacillopeptidase F [Evansella vedderi]
MTKRLAVALVFLLLFTPFTSVAAQTSSQQDNSTFTTMQDSTKTSAADKVDSKVISQFETEEYVNVIIELAEQVDTTNVAAQAREQLGVNAKSYNQKMAARNAVFDSLKSTAEATQASLLQTLEKAQETGDVKEFRSFYIMNVISVTATKDVIETLSYLPEVARILENEIVELILPEQSEAPPMVTDDGVEWNIDRVQAPAAWNEFGVTGEGIVVGVIDTGVQWNHPALMENFRGYNPSDPDNPEAFGNWYDAIGSNSLPADGHGHGTHVTGTVMGQDPSGDNKIGVAPDAQWIAAAACSAAGCPRDALLAAGEYMLAPEDDPSLAPDIVQNSWGGSPGIDEWYRPMVQAWRDAGQLPVFSAGNSGPGASTVTPPANYPEAYAVAATDSNDNVASFSSRGPANYSGDQKPNISAPGVNIRSSVPGSGYEGGWNGTSMASPHISGVAALLLSVDASLTPDELEDILNDTAIPLTDSQYTSVPNDGYGVGLVNAYEAVAMIADGTGFISGQVLTDGSDDEPPVIDHTPFDFSFSGIDLPLTAEISDNIAVVEAEIIVHHEAFDEAISIPMSRTSGDHLAGNYAGIIPHEYAVEPGFEYHILAHDFGGNTTATDTFWVDIQFGILPDEYTEDFSELPLGWKFNGSWEWGEPSGNSPNPLVGDKLVGTNLSGNYPANAEDVLLLPPLDLRNTDEASLRMNHWYDLERNYDYGYIGISDDYGENWEIVSTFNGRDQEWRSLIIDLNDYAGSDTPIFVAFELTSDSIIHYLGWYLDNVELVGVDTTPPDAPTNLEASATSTSINLSWSGSIAPDTSGYNIYRAEAESDFEKIGNTANTNFSDANAVPEVEYTYYVTAYDFSGNESEPSNEVTGSVPYVDYIFYSNFEDDDGGFTPGGDDNHTWEWGIPTVGPDSAYIGEKLWATNLSGNIRAQEDSWITSPEIELTSVDTAELNFALWHNVNNNWTFGYVEVSKDDGDSWDELMEFTGEADWHEVNLSLNDYVGETIELRIRLDGSAVARPGIYVDHFGVLVSGDDVDEVIETVKEEDMVESEGTFEDREAAPAPTFVKIQSDMATHDFKIVSEPSSVLSSNGLPVIGTVTIIETDRTTHTNPMTGEYTLRSPATESGETVTVRAEAYGFYPKEATVEVTEDATTFQNFMLDPLPTGDIKGTITNVYTDLPVEDARIQLVEDPKVPDAYTDENGTFTMPDVFEGDYTIRVSAQGYHPSEFVVSVQGGEIFVLNVTLEQFIGYEDEIAYDNGNAENALVLNAAGNGLAVKFTPDGMAELRGVNMYVWDTDWPTPGGNEINIVVYDTDANGNPKERVIGPVPVVVDRGEWNYIDLSDHGFVTEGDFFISTLQDHIGNNSPGIGTDEEHPNAQRSYLYVNGDFQEHFDNGNFMIRASVAYALDPPAIDSPVDGTFTTEDTIEVTGVFAGDGEVTVYNNGEEVAVAHKENGQFSVTIQLEEGVNEIFAEGDAEGIPLSSDVVTVVKDTIDPEITIDSPVEGTITNDQAVTMSGTVVDANLDTVTVNGKEVAVDEDGAFSERLVVEEGENTFMVTAVDLAGNSSTEEVMIFVDWTPPTIEDVTPAEDVHLYPGETVAISFTSDSESGEASFLVSLPSAMGINNAGVTMEEVEPGYYVGTWTAPEAQFEKAEIIITMTDAAGNTSKATAEGKLSVEIVTLDTLYKLVDDFENEGELSRQAANQLRGTLESAESQYDRNRMQQAISQLERFISQVESSNHMRDVSEEVKAALTKAAERLLQDWKE